MEQEKIDQIRGAIKEKYQSVAETPKGLFNYPTGREGLAFLNYRQDYFANLSEQVVDSFCGVGNLAVGRNALIALIPGLTELAAPSPAGMSLVCWKKPVLSRSGWFLIQG